MAAWRATTASNQPQRRGRPAGGAQGFAVGVGEFRREGAFADARGVGLEDADDTVDPVGRETGAGAGAAADGVGAGDVGVGAQVDVEHHALRALEEDFLAARRGLVQQGQGVADEWREGRDGGFDARDDGGRVEGFAAEGGEGAVVGVDALAQEVGEGRVEEVAGAQAGAGHLVAVGGADAAQGGADLAGGGLEGFAAGVEGAVVGEHQVGAVADEEASGGREAARFEAADFFDEPGGVEDDAVADDAALAFVEDAGGDEVQHEALAADFDGVAGVVAALGAHDPVGALGQDVDDLAFAFVAPLGADQDGVGHGWVSSGGLDGPGV